jgi:iron-sulfur cluster assembly protein
MSAVASPTVELNVTENAAVEIKKFLSSEEDLPETSGLRVRVVPGGCTGFQYSSISKRIPRQGDFILDKFGIKLFVDMFSAQYLNGVVIDYTSNMMGSGFTFENRTRPALRLWNIVLSLAFSSAFQMTA